MIENGRSDYRVSWTLRGRDIGYQTLLSDLGVNDRCRGRSNFGSDPRRTLVGRGLNGLIGRTRQGCRRAAYNLQRGSATGGPLERLTCFHPHMLR